jgi:hypothetical protein
MKQAVGVGVFSFKLGQQVLALFKSSGQQGI